MIENKNELVKSAMAFGMGMGIYWVFKYIFFIWGFTSPSMNAVYWGLTGAVPFIAYNITKRYKQTCGGKVSFFHAWQFGVLLYTFAALIVSLIHYVFYRYIAPPDLLTNALNQTIELLKQYNPDSKMIESVSSVDISPIQMAIQGIFSNIFYGVIFSIPVAMIVSRNKQTINTPPPSSNENNE